MVEIVGRDENGHECLRLEIEPHRVPACELSRREWRLFLFNECRLIFGADIPRYEEYMGRILASYDFHVESGLRPN